MRVQYIVMWANKVYGCVWQQPLLVPGLVLIYLG